MSEQFRWTIAPFWKRHDTAGHRIAIRHWRAGDTAERGQICHAHRTREAAIRCLDSHAMFRLTLGGECFLLRVAHNGNGGFWVRDVEIVKSTT